MACRRRALRPPSNDALPTGATGLFTNEELASLRRLVDMGFSRDRSLLALLRSGWCVDRAALALAATALPSGEEPESEISVGVPQDSASGATPPGPVESVQGEIRTSASETLGAAQAGSSHGLTSAVTDATLAAEKRTTGYHTEPWDRHHVAEAPPQTALVATASAGEDLGEVRLCARGCGHPRMCRSQFCCHSCTSACGPHTAYCRQRQAAFVAAQRAKGSGPSQRG